MAARPLLEPQSRQVPTLPDISDWVTLSPQERQQLALAGEVCAAVLGLTIHEPLNLKPGSVPAITSAGLRQLKGLSDPVPIVPQPSRHESPHGSVRHTSISSEFQVSDRCLACRLVLRFNVPQYTRGRTVHLLPSEAPRRARLKKSWRDRAPCHTARPDCKG
ncbi:hypothetical protein GCM10017781_46330 [Deinococcus metalli]|uniref:Uncharacterized protein n=1 Tax=Deinococcus metalli TaxID=1141878 RepID=A0ABQ3JX91_9DEIO|nr:hypothetical protein GCM10017781_46330 [Deinococcus metalli]